MQEEQKYIQRGIKDLINEYGPEEIKSRIFKCYETNLSESNPKINSEIGNDRSVSIVFEYKDGMDISDIGNVVREVNSTIINELRELASSTFYPDVLFEEINNMMVNIFLTNTMDVRTRSKKAVVTYFL